MEAVIAAQAQPRVYTLEEYFGAEAVALQKHAFINGAIIPMPGGTYNHNLIALNIGAELRAAVKSLPRTYRVLNSDMKIMIEHHQQVVYPDALVICDAPAFYEGRKDVIINPLVIVEVLSRSTEVYDFGDKFVRYSSIPGFREYVLLEQETPEATCFFQEEPGLWRKTVISGLAESLVFQALQTSVRLAEVYEGVEW